MMSSLIQIIESLDRWLLLLINGAHTPFLDQFMWMVSGTIPWLPFYLTVIVMLALCYRKNFWRVFFVLFLVVAFADIFSSGIVKPWVARFRPTHEPALEGVLRMFPKPDGRFYYGGLYGFFSSHAANTTSIALLFYHFIHPYIRKKRILVIFLTLYVTVVCYSRMYIGAHYPTDILTGVLFAFAICIPVKYCFFRMDRRRLWT